MVFSYEFGRFGDMSVVVADTDDPGAFFLPFTYSAANTITTNTDIPTITPIITPILVLLFSSSLDGEFMLKHILDSYSQYFSSSGAKVLFLY